MNLYWIEVMKKEVIDYNQYALVDIDTFCKMSGALRLALAGMKIFAPHLVREFEFVIKRMEEQSLILYGSECKQSKYETMYKQDKKSR